MNRSVIDVAVCIVESIDGQVLLAQRTARQISAGFWELPGGKIEPGETAAQAARRELQEETGLTPIGLTPWISYEHQFPTRRLRLHFFRTRRWEGVAHGREGQRLEWADPRAPRVGPILPSNDRALFALRLPPAYVVADFGVQDSHEDGLARLRNALSQGEQLIRVRIAPAAPGQRAALLARIATLADAFAQATILTGHAMDAARAGLAGVHSCTRELRRLTARPSVRVWSATCHHQADVSRAVSLGADFVVLAPVLADPERPHLMAHGWDGLQRIARACPIGVYAQGGVAPEQMQAAHQAGSSGLVVSLRTAAGKQDGHTKDARQHAEMFT